MNEPVSDDLKKYLHKMCGLSLAHIKPEKDIIKDFKIRGDDFWELIDSYGRDFSVDLSDVNWTAFDQSEGIGIFRLARSLLRRIFQIHSSTLESARPEPGITVGDLERGIQNKKLVLKD